MKVTTKVRFREKDDFSVIHEVGSVFECTEERGKYLISLGFAEAVKEKKAEAVAVEAEKTPADKQPTQHQQKKKKKTMPFSENETGE